MYPVGIAAPDATTEATLRDRLLEGLAAEGRVAAVDREPPDPPDAGATAARLAGDGTWSIRGVDADLPALLDDLAPDHDYAVITGFPDARLPHVAVGESGFEGEVLHAAETPGEITVADVLGALEGAEPHVTLESLVAEAKRSPDADRAGAIATFTGRVRERDAPDDRPTTRLEFEKYDGIAAERLADLEAELGAREGVHRVLLHHRTGVIPAGRDIVFVVVLAGHREEAFRTVEDGINRLKAEVPIFKKEVTVEEEFWVHEQT